MEQIMKEWMTKMMAKMDSNQERTDAAQREMKASQEEMMAKMETSEERTDASLEEMKAIIRSGQEEMIKAITGACREAMEACEGVTHACLEEKEPAPEETGVVSEPQEVPEGATDAETIGATENRSRDLRLAVGCRRKLKTWTKRDGRVRREHAATIGWPTHRTVPVIRKGGLRRGPSKKCLRSGIRGPGRTLGSRMTDRGLKKCRTKVNVIRGTPKGRTCEKRRRTRPEGNNGIRDRGAKEHLLLKKERTLNKDQKETRHGDRKVDIRVFHPTTRTGGRDTVEVSAPAEAEEVTP
jgi:hypothetical protein